MYRFDFDKLRKNERWEMSLWKNLEEENGINIQKVNVNVMRISER